MTCHVSLKEMVLFVEADEGFVLFAENPKRSRSGKHQEVRSFRSTHEAI